MKMGMIIANCAKVNRIKKLPMNLEDYMYKFIWGQVLE